MKSLGKPQLAARPEKKRINVLVVVAGAESAQHDATFVRLAVAIVVFEKQQFRAVADIRTAITQFDPGRNHQAGGEDGCFVAPPVAVRIFENENFVVRHLAGFDLRIDRTTDDPEPTARVETNLNRFHDTVLFRRKEADLETVGHLERSKFGGGIVWIGCERGGNEAEQTPEQSSREN